MDEGLSIVTSPSGNIYTTGFFIGTADFDPGPGVYTLTGTGNTDIFVSKLDASGNFIWARRFGGPSVNARGLSIAIDAYENVYTTGFFDGTVDFDPGPGVYTITASGTDVFVSKLDAAGNFLFAVNMGGASNEIGYGITLDSAKNIFITGNFQSTADFDPSATIFNITSAGLNDAFVTKLDSLGKFIWAKGMGGSADDNGNSVSLDLLGNVYFTGSFSTIADFDPGPGTYTLASVGNADIFISKLDPSGNFVWTAGIGGTTNDDGMSITTDAFGNVFTMGNFFGTADFDPGAAVFNMSAVGVADVFVSKMDASGNLIWAKSIGGSGMDMARGIKLDLAGNIYLAGYFQTTADFDPGPGVLNFTTAGGEDMFVEKLDVSGNLVWARRMGGTSNDFILGIDVDASGYIYTTGSFYGTVDFDPNAAFYNMSAQWIDVFVHKMSQCPVPVITGTVSGNTNICWGSNNTYSISSVTGATYYTWNFPGGWTGSSTTNIVSATSGNTGNISVTASGLCGTSLPLVLNVVVNAPPTITASTSNTILCSNQSATLSASGASSYTWNPGGSGNSIVVSPSVTTSYTVTGTGTNGCTNIFVFTQLVSSCTNINQLENLSADIYPNPANGIVYANFVTETSGVIELYNLIGEKLLSRSFQNKSTVEINLEEFSNGIYFVKVAGTTMKIVKVD